MKNTMKKLTVVITALSLVMLFTYSAIASGPRDNDKNAIIYGGAYSVGELKGKLANGSGPNPGAGVYGNWQTPNGVRTFYNSIGIYENQFGNLTNGIVKKDGTVWVGLKTVAAGVFASRRVNMGAATLVHDGPTPIYWRGPK